MHKITISVCSVLFTICSAYADVCPTGFTYIGEAYGEGNADGFNEAKHESKNVHIVKFPRNFILDNTYVQSGGKWSGGYEANPVMTAADVPNGLHIIASGTEGGHKGWAIHKPQFVLLERNKNTIVQFGYNIPLYCHTGSGEADKGGAVSCNVRAVVCAKEDKS